MPALFQIADDYRNILSEIEAHAEANDGDVTGFPLLERLAKIEGDLKDKALNIAALVKEITADGKAITELGESIVARGRAKLKRAEGLKNYLTMNVPMNAVFEDARAKVSWAGNGGKRPIEVMPEVNPADLPDAFKVIEVRVDSEAIREALEGQIVEGQEPEKTGQAIELEVGGKVVARLNPRGKSLRIK
jgi:hypothetical protein